MLRTADLHWYQQLAEGAIAWSRLPVSFRKREQFQSLLGSGILRKERQGAGFVVCVYEAEAYAQFLRTISPAGAKQQSTKSVDNVARFRNSKAATKAVFGIVFLRGSGIVQVNGQAVDLAHYTSQFGLFSTTLTQLETDRICIVENLDCFMQAEKLVGPDWTLMHTYGRLGSQIIQSLQAREILHFPDYDYTGLDEFLRLQEIQQHATLFVPDQLESLFHTFSTHLKKGATPSARVRNSDHPELVRIKNLIAQSNRMLEQQACFIDQNPAL